MEYTESYRTIKFFVLILVSFNLQCLFNNISRMINIYINKMLEGIVVGK